MKEIKIYVSETGKRKFELKLQNEVEKLENIRKEKSLSWHDDGDGVHDNPLYHQFKDNELVQTDYIHKLRKIYANFVVIEVEKRDTETVSIGSIIKYEAENINSKKKK